MRSGPLSIGRPIIAARPNRVGNPSKPVLCPDLQLPRPTPSSTLTYGIMAPSRPAFRLPLAYRLFFLFLEPISALVGAFYTQFRQQRYLELLDSATAPPEQTPLGTSVAMSQLANMYFFFAINEALVLRSTWDLRVWRTVLLVLLIADLGHLYSMKALGPGIYYNVTAWNAGDVGNVPWVYAGATMRLCFLAGIGL
ncbi:hypothetical protein V8C37DRAFT_380456 [Trichoderma ceciliae]